MQDHTIRMSELLGRPAHVDEVFQQMHIRKETGQFIDDRSRRTHEDLRIDFPRLGLRLRPVLAALFPPP
ncbi:hypothetical protein E2542_SST09562 [Spatholobus suberectus]|nr:hypothetical protein E2542_SST09562 [Spatholobus suberectus]